VVSKSKLSDEPLGEQLDWSILCK